MTQSDLCYTDVGLGKHQRIDDWIGGGQATPPVFKPFYPVNHRFNTGQIAYSYQFKGQAGWLGRHSAIDGQCLAGDVSRCRARQKQYTRRNVVWMPNSLGWNVLFNFRQNRFAQLSAHF